MTSTVQSCDGPVAAGNSMQRSSVNATWSGRLRFYFYAVLAIFAFATIHAVEQYQIAQSPPYRILGDHGWRQPTHDELVHHNLIEPFFDGLFAGFIFVLLDCLPALWFLRVTTKISPGTLVIRAIAFGALAGAAISILVWAASGGWGPPFFFPNCVAGAFIIPALVLTRRCAPTKKLNPGSYPETFRKTMC